MFEISRDLYRELKPMVIADTKHPGRSERVLLAACEQTVARIARDLRRYPRPARHLFSNVRFLFPVQEQLNCYRIIERHLSAALTVPRGRSRSRHRAHRRTALRLDQPQGSSLRTRAAAGLTVLPVAQAPGGHRPDAASGAVGGLSGGLRAAGPRGLGGAIARERDLALVTVVDDRGRVIRCR